MRSALAFLLIASAVAISIIEAAAYVAAHRQDFPWTEIDLDDPIGSATANKLAALGGDTAGCRALLTRIGDADQPVPAFRSGPSCAYSDGMRLTPNSAGAIQFQPRAPVTSCAMAAALMLWERDIIQPAATRHIGQAVARIIHAGSYSCRRLYGRSQGEYSEHARANAFDVLGFVMADGKTVSVLRHWSGDDERAAFLRDVRDGGCRLFATVLSPDYNAAHADHLHLDQARRGASGRSMCR